MPVIKYFKQMGFKLEEMKEFLESDTYEVQERGFLGRRSDELRAAERRYQCRLYIRL